MITKSDFIKFLKQIIEVPFKVIIDSDIILLDVDYPNSEYYYVYYQRVKELKIKSGFNIPVFIRKLIKND